MSRDLGSLKDILDSAKNAVLYISETNFDKFINDEIL